jgi:TetR/AcrR family transcriptional repressor of nem operon
MVKLGSEVCDLSEDMRLVLKTGSEAIIERLARCIEQGQLEGSVQAETPAAALAQSLYQLWLGASLLAKVSKDRAPFDTALIHMERLLS